MKKTAKAINQGIKLQALKADNSPTRHAGQGEDRRTVGLGRLKPTEEEGDINSVSYNLMLQDKYAAAAKKHDYYAVH